MAVQIRVLKGGKPVSGVSVFYRKESSGLTGEKITDSQGYVSFQIDTGMAAVVRLRGNGIRHETEDYYLSSSNEFRL